MYTFEDAIVGAMDYLGAKDADVSLRESKRAIINAYRDLATEHNWSYLFANGRINLVAPFSDGLVSFDEDTDSWTLSGNTIDLPTWAGYASIRVGDVIYKVRSRVDDYTFVTYPSLSPVDDLSSPVSYTLYQDTYPLPSDFGASDRMLYQRNFGSMVFVHPSEWLRDHRFTNQTGECKWYTITGDSKYPGRLVLRVFPYPSEAVSVDFVYRRMPRPLLYHSVSDGLMACSTSTPTTLTVSGSSLATSSLVGSVLRLSSSTSKPPTSPMGANPAAYEGIVTGYASGTYTVDQEVGFTGANLKYTISDPIDIEEGSMLTAFLRGVEKQISMQRVMKDKPSAKNQYDEALRKAKAADSRSFAGRAVGNKGNEYRQRLASMPITFN